MSDALEVTRLLAEVRTDMDRRRALMDELEWSRVGDKIAMRGVIGGRRRLICAPDVGPKTITDLLDTAMQTEREERNLPDAEAELAEARARQARGLSPYGRPLSA